MFPGMTAALVESSSLLWSVCVSEGSVVLSLGGMALLPLCFGLKITLEPKEAKTAKNEDVFDLPECYW